MAQFESGVKYVPYSQEQVFNKLSDLSNLESVRDKLADKVQGMEFDSDSLSFTVQGISITLRIIEREPYKCVKFESEKSPVPMNLWQRFDDIPQGSVLVAFLQKLRFCRLMDLIQSCQILIYGTRLLKKYSGAIYHCYIIVALKLNVKCFCIFYG